MGFNSLKFKLLCGFGCVAFGSVLVGTLVLSAVDETNRLLAYSSKNLAPSIDLTQHIRNRYYRTINQTDLATLAVRSGTKDVFDAATLEHTAMLAELEQGIAKNAPEFLCVVRASRYASVHGHRAPPGLGAAH
jgi:hypothetical protein